MVRALWTGASGMTAQQTNVDNIANNLSNVNTTGYKKTSTEFQTLLYQKLQREVTDNNGDPKPVIGQVGLGVKVAGVVSQYSQGSMLETGNDYDMAIEGDGFFKVRLSDGTTAYTRNGSFHLAVSEGGVALATADGHPILDTEGNAIEFGEEYDTAKLELDEFGNFMYPNAMGVATPIGVQIGLAQFSNPAGLEKLSGSLLKESDNSGVPRLEGEDPAIRISKIHTKFLEGSNVQTVDEIVNLITAQRAYEMNSKVITAADEMLQQANNLRS